MIIELEQCRTLQNLIKAIVVVVKDSLGKCEDVVSLISRCQKQRKSKNCGVTHVKMVNGDRSTISKSSN